MSILASRGAACPQAYGFLNGIYGNNGGPGLWAVGDNRYGQLGLGDTTSRNQLVKVSNDTTWMQIATGGENLSPTSFKGFTIALKSNGTIWGTGYNLYGQLGLGDTTNRNVLTQIGSDTDWAYVAAGITGTMAIKTNGTLWAWGYNISGLFGNGTNSNFYYNPTQIGTDTNWSKIWMSRHSIVQKTSGAIYTAGYNLYGQLGLGDNSVHYTLTQSGTATNWTKFAIGTLMASGLKSDGTIWSVGYNQTGSLGIGSTTDVNVWTQVGSDTNWYDIARPNQISNLLALKTDYTQYACGATPTGDIGFNPATNTNYWSGLQTTMFYLSNSGTAYTKIYGGDQIGIRLKADTTIFVSGTNFEGQLGLNEAFPPPLVTVNYPTELNSYTNWQSISQPGFASHILYIG